MKKIICTVLISGMLSFSLCSCNMRYLPVYGEDMADMTYFVIKELPRKNAGGETTLEFWIGETVDESDYEGHALVYDGFLGDVNTVDVTVSRLRKKLERDPSNPEYLITKRGVGYYFNK